MVKRHIDSQLLPRLLISFIGGIFLLYGISALLLGIFGERASAVVTDIRREGGERNEANPGRYTYNISYTFSLADGKNINGSTKHIGNGVYLKADGKSRIAVCYFPFFPYLNVPEQDTKPKVGQLIFMAVGLFLIVAVNRRRRKLSGRVAE